MNCCLCDVEISVDEILDPKRSGVENNETKHRLCHSCTSEIFMAGVESARSTLVQATARIRKLEGVVLAIEQIAQRRPCDGSQLDADLEALLLTIKSDIHPIRSLGPLVS